MPHDSGLLTPSTVVTRSDSQLSCRVDDEEVIMSLESGQYFGCDPVGTHVWSLIETPITIGDLCARLMADFPDVTAERCMSDILPFLRELVEEGLVTANGGSAAA